MKFKSITLYHKLSNGSFKKTYFDRCFVSKGLELSRMANISTAKNNVRIRLFCHNKIDITLGDYIYEGRCTQLVPQNDAFVIKSITENLDTFNHLKHYRLECV